MNHTKPNRPVTGPVSFSPDHPDWLWMGLMSGTSTDGVDAVLARFPAAGQPEVVASHALRFDAPLRERLLRLQSLSDHAADPSGGAGDRLIELEFAINGLTDAYAGCALSLLHALPQADRERVRAAGAHGQTLRHRPDLGITLQHFNPARFHVQTGLSVVSDFRRADVALGGQGAPLVPAFHRWWLEGLGRTGVVLNIGGFSNLSIVRSGSLTGCDAGPGNVLMDAWAQRHLGTAYDNQGAWAASGRPHAELLDALLQHPFLQRPLPRSTGRDDFHLDWLLSRVDAFGSIPAADVQATLLAFTVRAIADVMPSDAQCVLVCGGGAFNPVLMDALAVALPTVSVESTAAYGIAPDQMEALAFAWLARQRLCGLPGNVPAVTGARAEWVLGSLTGL